MECLIPQAEEALEYLLHDGACFAVENRTGAADVRAAGCVVCVVAWDACVKKSTVVVVVVVVLPVFLPATPETRSRHATHRGTLRNFIFVSVSDILFVMLIKTGRFRRNLALG